jgi:hypothetical protein
MRACIDLQQNWEIKLVYPPVLYGNNHTAGAIRSYF